MQSGNSLTISLPKQEIEDLDIDPEDLLGENVSAMLTKDGRYIIDLEP